MLFNNIVTFIDIPVGYYKGLHLHFQKYDLKLNFIYSDEACIRNSETVGGWVPFDEVIFNEENYNLINQFLNALDANGKSKFKIKSRLFIKRLSFSENVMLKEQEVDIHDDKIDEFINENNILKEDILEFQTKVVFDEDICISKEPSIYILTILRWKREE